MVVSFGKHKGKTFLELTQTDPGYLKWMYEKFDDGLFKKAAGEAIKYLISTVEGCETSEEPSFIKIKLLCSNTKFPGGMLAIKVSGDFCDPFEELHECCRKWDVENEYWVVPALLLGDILERFPEAKLSRELQRAVEWTAPVKFERKLNITPMGETPLPEHNDNTKSSQN